ncbi:MAG: hypothetical protein K6U74_16140, partial [Firmicutes bacterium]|nr:hypothetical protein [Bacillota bacterium]
QLEWLKSCMILRPGSSADGAITRYPDQGWITPYFSNFAAMALLRDPDNWSLVERYLDWYLRNLEENGTILDYHYDENFDAKTAKPDSEDAYAGTYLSLVCQWHARTGKTAWVKENLVNLKKVARAMINLMERDGLTVALASYRVKFLMDNCEVFKGLKDFAGLLFSLNDPEAGYYRARAGIVAGAIEKDLWDSRRHCYKPSKKSWPMSLISGVNLKKFYPDAACQVFPTLYGLIKPGSDRAIRIYKTFNVYQTDWVRIKPPDYPWMILGYCACLHGDYTRAYEKVRYAHEAYIAPESGNWFCAESAFYILTCAALLEGLGFA